jgi:nicotinate-nucleotide adenylyltransferase
MVELAVEGNAAFRVLDIESARPGVSFTVETVEALARLYPGDGLAFMTGLDAFLALGQWRDAARLVSLVDFIIIGRAGYGFTGLAGSPYLDLDAGALRGLGEPGRCVRAALKGGERRAEIVATTALEISATRIRDMVASGRSVRYLLPPPVESFIMSHGLYAGRRTDATGGSRRGCRVPEGG